MTLYIAPGISLPAGSPLVGAVLPGTPAFNFNQQQQQAERAAAQARLQAAQRARASAVANQQQLQYQIRATNAANRSLSILGSNNAVQTASAQQTKKKKPGRTRARTKASLRIGGTPTSSGSGLNITG